MEKETVKDPAEPTFGERFAALKAAQAAGDPVDMDEAADLLADLSSLRGSRDWARDGNVPVHDDSDGLPEIISFLEALIGASTSTRTPEEDAHYQLHMQERLDGRGTGFGHTS